MNICENSTTNIAAPYTSKKENRSNTILILKAPTSAFSRIDSYTCFSTRSLEKEKSETPAITNIAANSSKTFVCDHTKYLVSEYVVTNANVLRLNASGFPPKKYK